MTWFNRLSATMRYVLATVAVIVAAAMAYGLWLISDPGPMAFASDHMIALTDYQARKSHGRSGRALEGEPDRTRRISDARR